MADKEYNLEELLGGSVSSITEKFGDLSDNELGKLAELEKAKADGKTERASLLSAIEAEQKGRGSTKRAQELQAEAAKEGVTLYTQAEVDAVKQEQSAQGERLAAVEAELTKARGSTPAKARQAKPRNLSVAGEASADARFVAFTGDDDRTIPDLPELEFSSGDFERDRSTGRLVLKQPISFPVSAKRTQVSKVWLVDGSGKAAAVEQLVNPLPVGGGTTATIPSKFLAFDLPEAKAAA